MKKYMFGIDAGALPESIARLKSANYDGIVLGSDENALSSCRAAGLETWLCYGAHGLNGDDSIRARDPFGACADWFSSACPNAEENNRLRMEDAIALAKKVGAKGVYVDGARFASFASAEGIHPFFGCFCPRCMMKMERMGFDAEAIRDGVGALMRFLLDGVDDMPDPRVFARWMDFRAACVCQYMETFSARCAESGLMSAAFVFAPSLAGFVGQRPEALRSLDVISPMLYRDYPHEEGPACLGHEWRALMRLFDRCGETALEAMRIAFPKHLPFQPEDVGMEVRLARDALPQATLLPIIQTEDTRLEETAAECLKNGADGYGEFMYAQKAW